MKKHLKGFIAGFLVAIILVGSITTVFAAATQKKIDVFYDNYQIVIDGDKFEATDKSGVIEPFSYNGWIYAPFEHIAKALGKTARWDGNTKTLFLDTPAVPVAPKPKVTNFFDVLKAYDIKVHQGYAYEENKSFSMLGDEYTNGCIFYLHGYNKSSSGNSATTFYNLKGQYKVIKGMLGHIGATDDSTGTFSVYLDDKLYKEYPMTGNMLTTDIVIDVTGVQILKITATRTDTTNSAKKFGFGNVTIE